MTDPVLETANPNAADNTAEMDSASVPGTENGGSDQPITPPGGENPDEVWKDTTKVPYRRIEEYSHKLSAFEQKFEQTLNEIREQINNSTNKPADNTQPDSVWDKRVKEAGSWDKFIPMLEDHLYQSFQKRQQETEAKQKMELDKEIQTIKSAGLASTDAEVNAIMKFAVQKSEELKTSIPLQVAARWWKETYKAPDNKDGAAKVTSPTRNTGTSPKNSGSNNIRGKSLDDIVFEAKQNAPKA
jgi:hypothetical protein